MAHFQLKTERGPFSTELGGTRLYLSGSSGPEAVLIQLSKKVTLEIGGVTGATPAIAQFFLPTTVAATAPLTTTGPTAPDVVSVSVVGRTATITALRSGACFLTVGGANALTVFVGDFLNHTGMEHDLIASTFRSADPEKMHALNRMLFNNDDNLFNENNQPNINRWGPLACGTVSKVGGAAIFHRKLEYDYKPYYQSPIAGQTRSSIIIDAKKLDQGRSAIAARLAKGIPSIVGLIYLDSAIQHHAVNVTGSGGHTVLVVGCSSDHKKFLFIDVWKGGSTMKYEGGYTGRPVFPVECDGLGMFEVTKDATRNIDILQSSTPGSFNGPSILEVVAGPLT